MPDHDCPIVGPVTWISLENQRTLPAQTIVFLVVHKRAVSIVVSSVEASVNLVWKQVVGFAGLLHHRELMFRQILQLMALLHRDCRFGPESSGAKGSIDIAIAIGDIGRLCSAGSQPKLKTATAPVPIRFFIG